MKTFKGAGSRSSKSFDAKLKLFRGLADGSRLSILESLRGGPCTVTEVVEKTGLTQPNVSMHLQCLWGCGLVERQVKGRFTYYAVNASHRVGKLLGAAEDLLKLVEDRIVACAMNREALK